MKFFCECGNATDEYSFILEAKDSTAALEWLKEMNYSEDNDFIEWEEDYAGAIDGNNYYRIELFDENNEEHQDALKENGLLHTDF